MGTRLRLAVPCSHRYVTHAIIPGSATCGEPGVIQSTAQGEGLYRNRVRPSRRLSLKHGTSTA